MHCTDYRKGEGERGPEGCVFFVLNGEIERQRNMREKDKRQ